VNWQFLAQHTVHQVIEAEWYPFRDELEYFRLHAIDAHTDHVLERRLLSEGDDPSGRVLDHAEIEPHLSSCDRHGEQAAVCSVKGRECVQVEIGQHVSVDDQESGVDVVLK
jgi:hypothetical protein